MELFRDIYLHRENYLLHGLALIGVRAVLGVGGRGSPFNVQRSLHVDNLSREEVTDMFRQYQQESGQQVQEEVVTTLYDSTRGQPGLVGWFGELLTEKYNPGVGKVIDMDLWDDVLVEALFGEWNNTVMNMVAKARGDYMPRVAGLYSGPQGRILFNICVV